VRLNRIRRFFEWKLALTVDYYFKPWYPTHWLWLDAWFNSKHYNLDGTRYEGD